MAHFLLVTSLLFLSAIATTPTKDNLSPASQHPHARFTSNAQPTTPTSPTVPSVTVIPPVPKETPVNTLDASPLLNTQQTTQQRVATKDTAQSLTSKSFVRQHLGIESARTKNQHHTHSRTHYPPKKHAPAAKHQPKAAPPPKNDQPKQKHKPMITTPTFGAVPTFPPHAPHAPKRPQPSKNTKCTYKKRRCGTKCSSTTNKKGKCEVTVQVPKICQKKVVLTGLCSGDKPKLCNFVEVEPSICTKKKKTKVQCPPKRYRCRKQIVQKKSCPPDGCDKWRKKQCKKRDPKRRVPCKKPPKSCKDCRRNIFFAKCKRVRFKNIEVPCPQRSPLPSPSPSHSKPPMPATSHHPRVRGKSQKPTASPTPSPCRSPHHYTDPYSGRFFEPLPSAGNVESSQTIDVSSAKWAQPNVPDKSGKCSKMVAVTEYHTCKKKLPGNEMCFYGCRVRKCRPPPEDDYCKDRMPTHCPKHKKKICKTKKTITTTCTRPRKENCDSEVTVPYICKKQKKVKRPCKKTPCQGVYKCALEKFKKNCNKTIQKKFVCGKKKEKKMTACSWRGGSNCKAVYCNARVCH